MSTMTKEELKWMQKMNKLLEKCPSDRIGFFTIGDPRIHTYDLTAVDDSIIYAGGDLVRYLYDFDASFNEDLYFPRAVEGLCG